MTAVIVICALTVAALLALIFFCPAVPIRRFAVSIFWVAPVAGALTLWAGGFLTGREIAAGLAADSAVNPLKILVLFFSMTLLSTFLDEAGLFRWLAGAVLRRAGHSQRALFVYLYLAVSLLTVFTSNDIVVLTFTPFICYFAKNAEIDPVPYLFCEFVAANTWSMALIIGNPTNIYLAAGNGVDFAAYTAAMILPTAAAGAASFLVLWLLFGRKLKTAMRTDTPVESLSDKPTVALGVTVLGVCIAFLTVSSYLSLPMWSIALFACLALYAAGTVELLLRRKSLRPVWRGALRAPLDVVPFVLSMFVLVLALDKYGVTAALAGVLDGPGAVFRYGAASALAANLVNNIPMSVLFSAVTAAGESGAGALYAAVVGSNIGAFLTPMGALAGIMWMTMLKTHEVQLSYRRFIAYGVTVAIPALFAAITVLAVTA